MLPTMTLPRMLTGKTNCCIGYISFRQKASRSSSSTFSAAMGFNFNTWGAPAMKASTLSVQHR